MGRLMGMVWLQVAKGANIHSKEAIMEVGKAPSVNLRGATEVPRGAGPRGCTNLQCMNSGDILALIAYMRPPNLILHFC